MDNRLAKANSMFDRCLKHAWKCKNIKKDTIPKVFKSAIVIILLYCAESCVTYRRHMQLRMLFHQCCLCIILNNNWSDVTANIEVAVSTLLTMQLSRSRCQNGRPTSAKDCTMNKTMLWLDLIDFTSNNVCAFKLSFQLQRYLNVKKP